MPPCPGAAGLWSSKEAVLAGSEELKKKEDAVSGHPDSKACHWLLQKDNKKGGQEEFWEKQMPNRIAVAT